MSARQPKKTVFLFVLVVYRAAALSSRIPKKTGILFGRPSGLLFLIASVGYLFAWLNESYKSVRNSSSDSPQLRYSFAALLMFWAVFSVSPNNMLNSSMMLSMNMGALRVELL